MDSEDPARNPPAARSSLEVTLLRRPVASAFSTRGIKSFIRRLAAAAAAAADEVTVVFTGDEEIRELNARFRGVDGATDVLAFPGEEQPSGSRHQGDIVISVEKARRQAAQRHHSLDTEIRYLLIHGFLHLMGHDHETDDGEMERQERRLRDLLLQPARTGAQVSP